MIEKTYHFILSNFKIFCCLNLIINWIIMEMNVLNFMFIRFLIRGRDVMKMQKRIAVLLTVCLILTLAPTMSFADTMDSEDGQTIQASFADVSGHWASEAISKWADVGVVKGDSKGFRPNDPITRAEMAVILNNLMGYQKIANNSFKDVDSGAWYADAVLKANAAGVFSGDGAGYAAPTVNITREQACVMLARAFGVAEGSADKTSFKDAGNISLWAQPMVFGMESNQYIGGMDNGKLEPKAYVTRAQVVTMIDNAVKGYYTAAGTYTTDAAPTNAGANCVAIIKADGVTIKEAKITGDLIIAEGVGNGNVTIDGTTITGKLFVRGGGKDSIHVINGAQVNGRVTVERADGVVRIVSDGVIIANLDANTEVVLEGSFTNVVVAEGAAVKVNAQVENISVEAKASLTIAKDAAVDTIDIKKEATGAKISVSGTVNTVTTAAPKTEISITDTAKIAKVDATATATGTNVSMDKSAEVKTLNSDAAITTSGEGAPKSITGSGNVKIQAETEESSGGGGGGGGGTGGEDIDTTSPVVTAGAGNRISDTEATVKFTSNELGRYYYAVVNHNAAAPTVDTSGTGVLCTTAESTISLTLEAGAKDVYVRVKDAAGNISTAVAVEVPEYNQYGLVTAFMEADAFDNARVRLLTTEGQGTYYLADDLDVEAIKGQIVDYRINSEGDIGAIDPTNAAVSVASGLKILSVSELTINDTTNYDIAEDVVVFTYDGTTPGAVICSYGISAINYLIYNESISAFASLYRNDQGKVEALLIPASFVKVSTPTGLEGVAPTSTANNDGKITGVNLTMEYKRSTATTYSVITNSAITGLVPGTYDVRYTANGEHGAGPSVAVEVPEYVEADQYGLVIAFAEADAFDNARVRLLTAGGIGTYYLADDLDVEAVKGQIVAYGRNEYGDIGAMDGTNKATAVAADQLAILSAVELKIDGTSYNILADVIVFTYDKTTPDAEGCNYTVGSINSIEGAAGYPASVYLNEDGKVAALLIRKSS